MLRPASAFLRYDPFEFMRRVTDEFDRGVPLTTSTRGFPAVNVWQSSESAAVTAELAGLSADDIDISVKDDILSLSGERRAPETGEGDTWHLRERAFGRFSRTVRLPFSADPDRVEARLQNGVLQVMLHRRQEDLPRRIQVKSA